MKTQILILGLTLLTLTACGGSSGSNSDKNETTSRITGQEIFNTLGGCPPQTSREFETDANDDIVTVDVNPTLINFIEESKQAIIDFFTILYTECDFIGPQGPQGEPGKDGSDGEDGITPELPPLEFCLFETLVTLENNKFLFEEYGCECEQEGYDEICVPNGDPYLEK